MARKTGFKARLEKHGVEKEMVDFFKRLPFPYFRKKRKPGKGRWPRIEVGGDSMRVGKTTATHAIYDKFRERGIPTVYTDEDWKSNPYLVASYDEDDPGEVVLKSQKWFAQRKFEQLGGEISGAIRIQCVNPEMDFCYAANNAVLKRMSKEQFGRYISYYQSIDWPVIPAPDLLMYIAASDDALIDRVLGAARDFEKVDPKYFLTMKVVNERWLVKAKGKMNVLVVDTDDFDFAHQEKAKEQLADRVLRKLKRLGWEF